MQFGLLVIRGCLLLLPFICEEISLLVFNVCGWFSISNEILLFDLPINLNRDFDLHWVILLIPSYGMLSLQRYINVFFINSLVPMRFHLWRRPHDSLNFTFVESWLSFLVAVIDVSLWWHGKVGIISVLLFYLVGNVTFRIFLSSFFWFIFSERYNQRYVILELSI